MARTKPTAPANTSVGDSGERLTRAALRKRLAELDEAFVALANQRTILLIEATSAQTPSATAAAGEQASADHRADLVDMCDEVARRVIERQSGPLAAPAVAAMLRELNSGVRALIRPVRVAYLGPEFSYSHLAATSRFGQSAEMMPVGTISAVFEEVEAGQAEYGLVPLENSTDGRISDTLDNFARRPVRICGEVPLRIHHNLLGRGTRSDIREVQSKPQALSQCRNWLARHLPAARLVEVTSTTAAAQAARETPGVAAIASRQAAVNYGLAILAASIEDNPENVTRFAVLGQEAARRSGDDKTALMFELAHKSGALADAIAVFKRHRINLTWLESFPMTSLGKDSPEGGYFFFIEFVGHRDEARVRRALAALEKRAKRLEILGSYARGETVE